jgi:hypothetical protein
MMIIRFAIFSGEKTRIHNSIIGRHIYTVDLPSLCWQNSCSDTRRLNQTVRTLWPFSISPVIRRCETETARVAFGAWCGSVRWGGCLVQAGPDSLCVCWHQSSRDATGDLRCRPVPTLAASLSSTPLSLQEISYSTPTTTMTCDLWPVGGIRILVSPNPTCTVAVHFRVTLITPHRDVEAKWNRKRNYYFFFG